VKSFSSDRSFSCFLRPHTRPTGRAERGNRPQGKPGGERRGTPEGPGIVRKLPTDELDAGSKEEDAAEPPPPPGAGIV